jgi:hypothetical protein
VSNQSVATFFFAFRTQPKPSNDQFGQVEGAKAMAWVVAESVEAADRRVRRYLDEYLWDITGVEQDGVETTLEQHEGKDLGILHFQKAQRFGIAVGFAAWGKNLPPGGPYFVE